MKLTRASMMLWAYYPDSFCTTNAQAVLLSCERERLRLAMQVMYTLEGIKAPDGGEMPPAVRAAREAGMTRLQLLIDRVEDCKPVA